jgi:hypothetical protein
MMPLVWSGPRRSYGLALNSFMKFFADFVTGTESEAASLDENAGIAEALSLTPVWRKALPWPSC